jgi:hypothetical protein
LQMKEQSNQVRAGGAISGVENHFFEKPRSQKPNLIGMTWCGLSAAQREESKWLE